MNVLSRVVSTLVLLTMFLGSALAASPAEPSLDSEALSFFTPTVAQAPDGTLWAAWVADFGDDREIVAGRQQQGTWGALGTVYANPDRWDGDPSLAMDAGGVPWLAWSSSTGEDDMLHLIRWTGHGWSEPLETPAWETVPSRLPTLAPTPDGGLWLAWVGFDGNDDEIYAAFWNGLRWSEPQRVSGDDADPDAYDTHPRLVVGPDGSTWLAWISHDKFLDNEIFVARWDGQRWSGEQQVSDDDDFVNGHPSLAVAEDGTLWLAWHGRVSEEGEAGRRIHVRRWTELTGWGPEVMVSSSLDSVVTEERPTLALDSEGLPHVIWHVEDGAAGLGYTTFDGSSWSSPRWVVQDPVAESSLLMDGGQPLLTWWSDDASPTQAFSSEELGGAATILPVFEASSFRIASTLLVTNRHVAFGDSITWGQYDDPATGLLVGDYPARLEELLDSRVVESEVINNGVPGETTIKGKDRLLYGSWPNHTPEFLELMEGTNDITQGRDENEIAGRLSEMVKWMNKTGTITFLATLPPRLDDRNGETRKLNSLIAEVAVYRGVPLVDVYAAFTSQSSWSSLMRDNVHPNTQGMVVLADVFYQALLDNVDRFQEDTVGPTTWIDSLPSQSECGQVEVRWTGTDNLGQVVDYDVQARLNQGAWEEWLTETTETSAIYTEGTLGDIVSFQVRGRDNGGNEGPYSGPASTTIVDRLPPEEVHVGELPPVQAVPFEVQWSAVDACDQVGPFEVQYCAGSLGDCTIWQKDTFDTSAVLDQGAGPFQYGETYYFQARAAGRDAPDNWSDWSDPVSTLLARFALSGRVSNIRGEPVLGSEVEVADALAIDYKSDDYWVYLLDEGKYSLKVSRDEFGVLPPMRKISVTANITGLNFVLPPLDDVVSNGGFEVGWEDWEISGSLTTTLNAQPHTSDAVTATLDAEPHTGKGAVLLGGPGVFVQLSQSLTVSDTLTDATLSFLARPEGDESSTVQVELEGTPISRTQVIPAGGWTHVWLPAEAALGQDVTLTLTLSDTAAVHLDEVSLGSAVKGGTWIYLPTVLWAYEP